MGLIAWKMLCALIPVCMSLICCLWPRITYTSLLWIELPKDVIPILASGICLGLGISLYLKLRRGWIEGLVSIGLTILFLITLVFGVSVFYYETFDNPLAILAEDMWWETLHRRLTCCWCATNPDL